MRKLIYAINITLDGVCDHTAGIADTEVHDYFTDLMRDAGLLVYGRKTFELMVPFWPDMVKEPSGDKGMDDFARAFDVVPKLVFSRSLANVEDSNSTLAQTGLQAEISMLKQQQGGDIYVGGVSVPSQLIELGLVDEYIFVIHPVIAGEGRRLFDGANLPQKLVLTLVDKKVFKSGGVALRYVK